MIFAPQKVACVAEADGGLLSIQSQIDITRRRMNTTTSEARRKDHSAGVGCMTFILGESNILDIYPSKNGSIMVDMFNDILNSFCQCFLAGW